MIGEPDIDLEDIDLEGGSEFKSGAIEAMLYGPVLVDGGGVEGVGMTFGYA